MVEAVKYVVISVGMSFLVHSHQSQIPGERIMYVLTFI